jgi:hypothetical protein
MMVLLPAKLNEKQPKQIVPRYCLVDYQVITLPNEIYALFVLWAGNILVLSTLHLFVLLVSSEVMAILVVDLCCSWKGPLKSWN